MHEEKLCSITPESMKIISDAEKKLSEQCGCHVALVAYNAK